jgi:predicted metal-dependent HD superfamily phosphohydrolase
MNQFIPARWATFIQPEHAHWTMAVLVGIYSDYSTRPYHNWTHIRKCMELLDWAREKTPTGKYFPWREAELALLWHDAVYVPTSRTNEEDSVALLKSIEPKLREVDAFLAYKAIMSTKTHTDAIIPEVVDIDLAILGSGSLEYGYYTHAVRVEFGVYDNKTYAMGRDRKSVV